MNLRFIAQAIITGLPIVCLSAAGAAQTSAAGNPPSLAVAMDDSSDSYGARMKAMRSLGQSLTPGEVQSLYVLMDRKAGMDRLPLNKLNALKNEAADILRRQQKLPPDLTRKLMAMYADPGHDAVWRDYCIQHLGGCFARVAVAADQQAARDVLWAATGERVGGIGGTALLALCTNVGQAGIERDRLAARAYELAADGQTGELTRITALQICARLGERRILPVARTLAQSARSVPLRMSAVAAVGTLGEPADRAVLEGYARSDDVRLRTAAVSALKRLR